MTGHKVDRNSNNYQVILHDYMRYLRKNGHNISQDEVESSEDFQRILVQMRGKIINVNSHVTWGQKWAQYYSRKELELEELARRDVVQLRKDPDHILPLRITSQVS